MATSRSLAAAVCAALAAAVVVLSCVFGARQHTDPDGQVVVREDAPNLPASRRSHTAVFTGTDDFSMLVFGGTSLDGQTAFNDVWACKSSRRPNAVCKLLWPSNCAEGGSAAPPCRFDRGQSYQSFYVDGRFYIHGDSNDVWVFAPEVAAALSQPLRVSRYTSAAAAAAAANPGGLPSSPWTRLLPSNCGAQFPPCTSRRSVYVSAPLRAAVALFLEPLVQVWQLSLDGGEPKWRVLFSAADATQMPPESLPQFADPRVSVAWTGTALMAFGYAGHQHHAAWELDIEQRRWTRVFFSECHARCETDIDIIPSCRTDHAALWLGQELVLLNGAQLLCNTSNGSQDVPSAQAWRLVREPCGTEAEASVVLLREHLSSNFSQDVNLPIPRSGHTAVFTGYYILAFGGDALGLSAAEAAEGPASDQLLLRPNDVQVLYFSPSVAPDWLNGAWGVCPLNTASGTLGALKQANTSSPGPQFCKTCESGFFRTHENGHCQACWGSYNALLCDVSEMLGESSTILTEFTPLMLTVEHPVSLRLFKLAAVLLNFAAFVWVCRSDSKPWRHLLLLVAASIFALDLLSALLYNQTDARRPTTEAEQHLLRPTATVADSSDQSGKRPLSTSANAAPSYVLSVVLEGLQPQGACEKVAEAASLRVEPGCQSAVLVGSLFDCTTHRCNMTFQLQGCEFDGSAAVRPAYLSDSTLAVALVLNSTANFSALALEWSLRPLLWQIRAPSAATATSQAPEMDSNPDSTIDVAVPTELRGVVLPSLQWPGATLSAETHEISVFVRATPLLVAEGGGAAAVHELRHLNTSVSNATAGDGTLLRLALVKSSFAQLVHAVPHTRSVWAFARTTLISHHVLVLIALAALASLKAHRQPRANAPRGVLKPSRGVCARLFEPATAKKTVRYSLVCNEATINSLQ